MFSSIGVKKNNPDQKSEGRRLKGLSFRLLGIMVVGVILSIPSVHNFFQSHDFITSHSWVRILGVIICGLSVAFAIWAKMHLGKNWGMPMSDKVGAELITTGPYRYVRHPIYTGVTFAMLGSALAIGAWWLLLYVFVISYFIYSAKVEERIMLEKFPTLYPDYMKRTKMIIPFLF